MGNESLPAALDGSTAAVDSDCNPGNPDRVTEVPAAARNRRRLYASIVRAFPHKSQIRHQNIIAGLAIIVDLAYRVPYRRGKSELDYDFC
jgi:hypothetical protein